MGQGWISFVGVFVLKPEAILGATRVELSHDKPLTLLPFLTYPPPPPSPTIILLPHGHLLDQHGARFSATQYSTPVKGNFHFSGSAS